MKKIIFAALAVVAMASCNKETTPEVDVWNGELRIKSGIATRASGTTWEAKDQIGVFMSTAGTTTAVGVHNTKYATLSGSASAAFEVDSDFDPIYYPQSGNVDIVAHYPYNEDASLGSYPINVADQSDLTVIDFMSAKMVDVAKNKNALNLKFYHLLSQMVVKLKPAVGGGLTEADLAGATITVSGMKVAAQATVGYDSHNAVPSASYATSGEATDLSLEAAGGSATFIVVPQTANVDFTISTSTYGEFYASVEGVEFTSGDEHTYTISVSRTATKVEGSTINPWGEGDEQNLDADDVVL